jgi:hypothetical protein
MLISLCRIMTTSTSFCATGEPTVDQDFDHRWLTWLHEEDVVRLVHCVYSRSDDSAWIGIEYLTSRTVWSAYNWSFSICVRSSG